MQKKKNISTKLYMMITIILVFAYSIFAIEFFDTFNNSNPTSNPDGPDWTAQNSNAGWSESGTITDNGTHNTEGHLINDSSVYDNGVFTVKIHNGNNAGDLTSSHLGVLFRWSSTSSYYYLCFREASNTLNVTLQTDVISTSGGSIISDNTWNTGSDPFWARVKVIADTFTVFMSTDGSTFDSLGRFVDATHSTGSGFGIGCVGDWNSGPTIDSIHWKDTLIGGDVVKDNNTNNLNLGTSWVGGTAPLSYDTAVWDNTVTAANTVSLGANQTWAGIKIENPGDLVTISDSTLTLGVGGIDMSSATVNLTLNSDLTFGANQIFDVTTGRKIRLKGALTGAYSLTKTGAGEIVLRDDNNTYSGGTTVSGGTLTIGGATASGVLPGNVVNNGTVTFNRTDSYTYSGVISGSGAVTQENIGTTTLSSNQTYTGATSVTAGTLKQTGAGNDATATSGISISSGAVYELAIGHATRLSSSAISITGAGTFRKSGGNYNYLANGATTQSFNMSSGALVDITGGTLSQFTTSAGNLADLTIASGSNAYINDEGGNATVYFDALSGAGLLNIYNITNPRTVVLGVDNGSGTFSGVISNTGTLHVTKQGSGTQTFSGNNTYVGNTTISSGVLNIQSATALGATGSGTSITSGAALQLQGGITVPEGITVNGTGISSTGAIRNVADDNYITGNISLGSASSFGNDVSNFIYFDGIISGSATLTKVGNGPVVFRNANTYTGATTISSHILWINNDNGLGTTAGNTTVNSGASLGIYDSITCAEPLVINGTGAGGYGAIDITSGESFLTGTINVATNSRIYSEATEYNYIDGVISGSGDIEKSGTGAIVFRADNTYTGATTVSTGSLWIKHNNALGNSGTGTTVSSGASLLYYNALTIAEPLTINGTGNGGVGALSSNSGNNTHSGTIALASASSIGVGADTFTISGVISGANNFTKTGSGVLVLEGTNTFSGNTNISVGELRVNGSTSNSSAVSMSAGTKLSGDGSVGGFANLSPNATIEPGDGGPGKLTLEDGITFVSTCTLNVEIGTNSDTLAVVGGLTLDGTLNIDSISGFAPGDYTIATYTGAGSNSMVVGTNPNGDYSYSISIGSGEVVLTISDNADPTAINLSSSNVDEALASATVVGILTTTDPDVGDNHTYSLPVELDNSLFAIDSDSLETGTIFDYEDGDKSYSVSITTDDGNGGTFTDTFTITINNTLTASGDTNEIDFSNGWQIGGGSADARQLSSSKYFDGHLDEIRIENAARSADWIKLCYETQKLNQSCVTLVDDAGVELLPLTITNNVGAGSDDTIMVYTDSFTIIFDESQGGGIKWLSNAANKGGTNQVTSGSTLTLFDVRYFTNSYSVTGTLTLLESNTLFAKVKQEFQISSIDWDVIYTVYGDGRIYIDVKAFNSSGSDQSNTLIFRTYRDVVGASKLVVSAASAATSDFILNADDGAGQFDIFLSPFGLWSDASGIDSGASSEARIGYRDVSRVLKDGYTESWSFLLHFGHKNWNDTNDDVHYLGDSYQNPDSLEMNRGTYRLTNAWEENIKFHYNFDQSTSSSADGDTVNDYSGAAPTQYNGIIEGGTWTTGRWGDGALTLASADSIAVIGATDFNDQPVFTITGWIKKNGTGETDALIFGDDGATTTGFKLVSNSDNLKLVYSGTTLVGNIALGTDWRFVAATADVHKGWLKLFVDGRLDTTHYDITLNYTAGSNSVSIGNAFAGDIDDIRFYSKEISEETIYAMYNNSYRAGQGMHSLRCDNNSSIDIQIDGSSTMPHYNPIFEITNYWGTSKPAAVYYDGDWMTENTNYICYLDDANNRFYIGLKKAVRTNDLRIYMDDHDSTGAWTVGPTKKMVWGTSGSDFYVQNFVGSSLGKSGTNEWYLYWKMDNTNDVSNDGELLELKSSEVSPSTDITSATNVIPDPTAHHSFGSHSHRVNGLYNVESAYDLSASATYAVLESSDVRVRLRINNRTVSQSGESYGIRTEWTIYPIGHVFRWDSVYSMTNNSSVSYVNFYTDSGTGSYYDNSTDKVGGIYGSDNSKDFIVTFLNGKENGSFADIFENPIDMGHVGNSSYRGVRFTQDNTGFVAANAPWEMAFGIEIGEQGFNTAYIDSFGSGYQDINFTAGDMTTGTRLTNTNGDMDADGFNEKEGCFTVQASNNTIDFTLQAGGVDGSRFYPAIKISNYFANYKPKFVHLYTASDTVTLVEGYQYNCYLDKNIDELVIQLDTVLTADVNCYISDDEDLAVTLSEFYARAGQNCDTLFWTTESESENLGFWLYRRKEPKFLDSLNNLLEEDDVDTADGIIRQMSRGFVEVDDTVWTKVNNKLIPGAKGGTSHGPLNYSYIDRGLLNNMLYEYKLVSVANNRSEESFGPITVMPVLLLPKAFALLPNYPNPVRAYTRIRFNLPVESKVKLYVYNLQGRLIKKILNAEESMKPGFHKLYWNLKDNGGVPLASGPYIYRMKAGKFVKSRMMIIVK